MSLEHLKEQIEKERRECYGRRDGLTEQEGRVMDSLVTAWNEFTKLKTTHPSETNDFMNSIHQCQNILCMRILRRDYPEGYPTYNK